MIMKIEQVYLLSDSVRALSGAVGGADKSQRQGGHGLADRLQAGPGGNDPDDGLVQPGRARRIESPPGRPASGERRIRTAPRLTCSAGSPAPPLRPRPGAAGSRRV